LLACIDILIGSTPGRVLFVGDHETDVQCASNATAVLSKNGYSQTVLSAIFVRDDDEPHGGWNAKPDFTLRKATDIIALMSEPMHQ
jgi:phosphoglycolate phosphatase-like HAD superfamily hydrolase